MLSGDNLGQSIFRKFVVATEGAVGGVGSDGQEVFQNADLDIGKIDWSLGIAARLAYAEMVLAHREVEVCCVVCTLTVDVGCLSKAKRISLRSVCVSCLYEYTYTTVFSVCVSYLYEYTQTTRIYIYIYIDR